METRKRIFLFLSIFIQSSICTAEIATSNNQFGLQLYSALTSKFDGDFVLSPFPLSKLLAALYTRAGGDTGKEIRESLQFPGGDHTESVAQIVRDYGRVTRDFLEIQPLANLQSYLIFNNSLSSSEDFISILKNDLNITLISTNLSNLNTTLDKIMDWNLPKTLETETEQLLQEKLDENGTLALVSKSLFSADWVHPFHPSFTKPSPFYYDETHANQVDMMFTRASVPFAEIPELDCTSIALPYKTDTNDDEKNLKNQTASEEESENDFHRLQLIILLPNSRTGLPDLERKLKTYPFSRIPQQFQDTKDMFLYIPRFNASFVSDLSDIFEKNLGMQSLTNPEKVDLSKLLKENRNGTNPEIQISNIYHIVQFSMHETGSGTNNGGSVRVPNFSIKYISPDSFRANRPFIGFLYDQEKHIILNIFRKTS